MVKKIFRYVGFAALLVFIGYHSVYFKKLDEVKNAAEVSKFDAVKFAANYYGSVVPLAEKSIGVNSLITNLRTDAGKTFETYSNALGIGNIRYFLVQGTGTIQSINENNVAVLVKDSGRENRVQIATEFVFGNAIRDASGLIKIEAFSSTTDLNNVSGEINKIIRTKVLPPFKDSVKAGEVIHFTGAIEMNKKFPNMDDIEVLPITLKREG